MSNSTPQATPGSLQRLAGNLLGLIHSHLGLFSIEVEELRERALRSLVLAIIGAGAVVLCLFTLVLALLLMVDTAYRLYAVIGLLSLLLLLAMLCLGMVWREIRSKSAPFAMTLEELRRDKEQLLP